MERIFLDCNCIITDMVACKLKSLGKNLVRTPAALQEVREFVKCGSEAKTAGKWVNTSVVPYLGTKHTLTHAC